MLHLFKNHHIMISVSERVWCLEQTYYDIIERGLKQVEKSGEGYLEDLKYSNKELLVALSI